MYYSNLPKCYHEIFVKKRTSKTYYPACDMSKKFAKLLGKTLLRPDKLAIIESMGFVVEIDKQ